jgi:hypothetical protein
MNTGSVHAEQLQLFQDMAAGAQVVETWRLLYHQGLTSHQNRLQRCALHQASMP